MNKQSEEEQVEVINSQILDIKVNRILNMKKIQPRLDEFLSLQGDVSNEQKNNWLNIHQNMDVKYEDNEENKENNIHQENNIIDEKNINWPKCQDCDFKLFEAICLDINCTRKDQMLLVCDQCHTRENMKWVKLEDYCDKILFSKEIRKLLKYKKSYQIDIQDSIYYFQGGNPNTVYKKLCYALQYYRNSMEKIYDSDKIYQKSNIWKKELVRQICVNLKEEKANFTDIQMIFLKFIYGYHRIKMHYTLVKRKLSPKSINLKEKNHQTKINDKDQMKIGSSVVINLTSYQPNVQCSMKGYQQQENFIMIDEENELKVNHNIKENNKILERKDEISSMLYEKDNTKSESTKQEYINCYDNNSHEIIDIYDQKYQGTVNKKSKINEVDINLKKIKKLLYPLKEKSREREEKEIIKRDKLRSEEQNNILLNQQLFAQNQELKKEFCEKNKEDIKVEVIEQYFEQEKGNILINSNEKLALSKIKDQTKKEASDQQDLQQNQKQLNQQKSNKVISNEKQQPSKYQITKGFKRGRERLYEQIEEFSSQEENYYGRGQQAELDLKSYNYTKPEKVKGKKLSFQQDKVNHQKQLSLSYEKNQEEIMKNLLYEMQKHEIMQELDSQIRNQQYYYEQVKADIVDVDKQNYSQEIEKYLYDKEHQDVNWMNLLKQNEQFEKEQLQKNEQYKKELSENQQNQILNQQQKETQIYKEDMTIESNNTLQFEQKQIIKQKNIQEIINEYNNNNQEEDQNDIYNCTQKENSQIKKQNESLKEEKEYYSEMRNESESNNEIINEMKISNQEKSDEIECEEIDIPLEDEDINMYIDNQDNDEENEEDYDEKSMKQKKRFICPSNDYIEDDEKLDYLNTKKQLSEPNMYMEDSIICQNKEYNTRIKRVFYEDHYLGQTSDTEREDKKDNEQNQTATEKEDKAQKQYKYKFQHFEYLNQCLDDDELTDRIIKTPIKSDAVCLFFNFEGNYTSISSLKALEEILPKYESLNELCLNLRQHFHFSEQKMEIIWNCFVWMELEILSRTLRQIKNLSKLSLNLSKTKIELQHIFTLIKNLNQMNNLHSLNIDLSLNTFKNIDNHSLSIIGLEDLQVPNVSLYIEQLNCNLTIDQDLEQEQIQLLLNLFCRKNKKLTKLYLVNYGDMNKIHLVSFICSLIKKQKLVELTLRVDITELKRKRLTDIINACQMAQSIVKLGLELTQHKQNIIQFHYLNLSQSQRGKISSSVMEEFGLIGQSNLTDLENDDSQILSLCKQINERHAKMSNKKYTINLKGRKMYKEMKEAIEKLQSENFQIMC